MGKWKWPFGGAKPKLEPREIAELDGIMLIEFPPTRKGQLPNYQVKRQGNTWIADLNNASLSDAQELFALAVKWYKAKYFRIFVDGNNTFWVYTKCHFSETRYWREFQRTEKKQTAEEGIVYERTVKEEFKSLEEARQYVADRNRVTRTQELAKIIKPVPEEKDYERAISDSKQDSS